MQKQSILSWMDCALQEAKDAFNANEVPVGAVLVRENELIAKAHNMMHTTQNPLLHAEFLVIREGLLKTGANHLRGCALFVTLEPCAFCAGAIDLCGLSSVYYGAYDPKMGQVDHNGRLLSKGKSLGRSSLQTYGGICEGECASLLTDFFKIQRSTH